MSLPLVDCTRSMPTLPDCAVGALVDVRPEKYTEPSAMPRGAKGAGARQRTAARRAAVGGYSGHR
eukprot:7342572-Prymnesium_polylepis.1